MSNAWHFDKSENYSWEFFFESQKVNENLKCAKKGFNSIEKKSMKINF